MSKRLAAAVLLLAAPAVAFADGFMSPKLSVTESDRMVSSPRQEAVLITDGSFVQVVLRTYFRKGPEELAWLVPIPAMPFRVRQADQGVFDELEAMAGPRFYTISSGGPSLGCGCGGAGSGAAVWRASPAVVVEWSGTAGIFKFEVLSARDAALLTRWLQDNGYAVPDRTEASVEPYVKAGWHWLAMRVRPDKAQQTTLAPHPVSYVYRADDLVYPLAISQLSAADRNEILLYVLADSRYAPRNWRAASVRPDFVRGDPSASSGTNYERLFQELTDLADGRAFVTEYAQEVDLSFPSPAGAGTAQPGAGGQPAAGEALRSALHANLAARLKQPYLTRLRAVMSREAMDRDVELIPSQSGPVANRYDLGSAAAPVGRGGGVLAAFAVVALGTVLRRDPRRALRAAGAACLLLGCALLAMA